MLFILLLALVSAALANIAIGRVEYLQPGWNGITVGGSPKPTDATGTECIALGYHAAATGYRHIALGGEARPLDDGHPLALSVHRAGVAPFGLGITLNGEAATIPLVRQRLASHRQNVTRLWAHSATDQLFFGTRLVVLPPTHTLEPGITFTLINMSADTALHVQTASGTLKAMLPPRTSADLKCIDTREGLTLVSWIAIKMGG